MREQERQDEGTAVLSSCGDLSEFAYGGRNIRFRTSPRLLRYTDVTEWDRGYIVCHALYEGSAEPEEEYVDLVPILKNLYIDPVEFTRPIKKVEVCYA